MSAIRELVRRWGRAKTARRYGVTVRTVQRWEREGPSERHWSEVQRSWERVEAGEVRRAQDEEWAREQLSRWVGLNNQEADIRQDLKRLDTRTFKTASRQRSVQLLNDTLAETEHWRRQTAEEFSSSRFLRTPTGKQYLQLRGKINHYSEQYQAALTSNNPNQISQAWRAWEHQVKRFVQEFEGLEIEGSTTRQVYTMFHS